MLTVLDAGNSEGSYSLTGEEVDLLAAIDLLRRSDRSTAALTPAEQGALEVLYRAYMPMVRGVVYPLLANVLDRTLNPTFPDSVNSAGWEVIQRRALRAVTPDGPRWSSAFDRKWSASVAR